MPLKSPSNGFRFNSFLLPVLGKPICIVHSLHGPPAACRPCPIMSSESHTEQCPLLQLSSSKTPLPRTQCDLVRLQPGDDLGFQMLRRDQDQLPLYVTADVESDPPLIAPHEAAPTAPSCAHQNRPRQDMELVQSSPSTATPPDGSWSQQGTETPETHDVVQGQAASAPKLAPSPTRAVPHPGCQSCGRRRTPYWRTGPNGKSTLCNVCGLVWRRRRSIAASQRSEASEKQTGHPPS